MTSGGNRKPVKADHGTGAGRLVMGEIRWSAGNLGERLADRAVLAVLDPAGRVDPQRALEVLTAGPSSERIGGGRERRIRAAPSHLLRERVTEPLGLLRQRPPDRLPELEQLEAIRRATEVLSQAGTGGRSSSAARAGDVWDRAGPTGRAASTTSGRTGQRDRRGVARLARTDGVGRTACGCPGAWPVGRRGAGATRKRGAAGPRGGSAAIRGSPSARVAGASTTPPATSIRSMHGGDAGHTPTSACAAGSAST